MNWVRWAREVGGGFSRISFYFNIIIIIFICVGLFRTLQVGCLDIPSSTRFSMYHLMSSAILLDMYNLRNLGVNEK